MHYFFVNSNPDGRTDGHFEDLDSTCSWEYISCGALGTVPRWFDELLAISDIIASTERATSDPVLFNRWKHYIIQIIVITTIKTMKVINIVCLHTFSIEFTVTSMSGWSSRVHAHQTHCRVIHTSFQVSIVHQRCRWIVNACHLYQSFFCSLIILKLKKIKNK